VDCLALLKALQHWKIFEMLIKRSCWMAQIILGENEGIESALRRFKRQVSKADIFADMKKNRHFETPLQKEKRKALARRKKRRFRSKP
jgi:small subunit ribosomal protein S21